jgi:integrase
MKKQKAIRDGVFQRKDRQGWYVSYLDAQGRRRKEKVHAHTLQQARDTLARRRDGVERTKVLGFTPPTNDDFDKLADRYLNYQKPRLTARAYDRESGIVENHLKPAFKGKVASIRRHDIQNYVTDRGIEAAPASVTKEYRCLSHMLGLAAEWEIIPASPASKIKTPKAPAGRVRYLQPGEVKAVLFACPQWLRPIVGLAVTTGMRRGEILGLRVLDVDIEGGRLMLPQTKNGDGRIVHLNQAAKLALKSVLPHSGPSHVLIFDGVCADYVTQSFRKACADAGISDFRFHDLRHTAASWLVMSGASLRFVADQLGHRDIRMTMRYSHLSASHRADAINRLDGVFGFLCPRGVPGPDAPGESLAVSASV